MEGYVDAPLEVREQRDPKGLYRKGETPEFTGIPAPYDPPGQPAMVLRTGARTEEAGEQLLAELLPGTRLD